MTSSVSRFSDASFKVLQYDMLQERALALNHSATLTDKAMIALRAFDAAGGGTEAERLTLVRRAAKVVWAYFVQREACGMRDHREVIKAYGIPGEVLVRLGAIEPNETAPAAQK